MQLRDYQQKAVDAIRASFSKHRRTLFVLPTGGGKTVVFSYIAQNASQKNKRVLILAHRIEICDQISRSLTDFNMAHGLLMPREKMTFDKTQIGMVQTVARRLSRIEKPDLIVVDEAHHAVAGSWRKITAAYPDVKILGVTATAARLDGRGLGEVFDDLIVGTSMRELIDMGFLSAYDYYAPPNHIDLSELHTQAGDYKIDELEAVMDKAAITGSAVQHYKQYLNGKPAIVFCTTLKHAAHVVEQFKAQGWRCDSIDGKMTTVERRRRVADLGCGNLHVLVSVDVISEGFDLPIVGGAILLRPTKSLTLFLQQVGRSLRPKPDGSRAIILDHVGNCHRHGMPDEAREWSLEGKIKKTNRGPQQCNKCYKVFYSKPPCSDPECPVGRGGGNVELPEEGEGELQAMADPYAWTNGINIALARGQEWKDLLGLAHGNKERLNQIRIIRKYHSGWVRHHMGDHGSERWRKK